MNEINMEINEFESRYRDGRLGMAVGVDANVSLVKSWSYCDPIDDPTTLHTRYA